MTLVSLTPERAGRDILNLFLVGGVVMIVFGIAAVAAPPLAGLTLVVLLGWLFLINGLLGLAMTLWSRPAAGFWWSLLSALLTIVAGAALFVWPWGGIISMSLVFAAFLTLDGAFTIALALAHRRHFSSRWAFFLINGVADFVFAAFLFWLPQLGAWALGLIVGCDMLIGGATLIALALRKESALLG